MAAILATIKRDSEGYLLTWTDWQPAVAIAIAAEEGLELTEDHWQIIAIMRKFYAEYHTSPTMRVLLKILADKLAPEKINSIYLYQLFPAGPIKQANKIAGLLKPLRCI